MAHITITEIVEMQRALADPIRVLILRLLLEREFCVCELVAILDEPQYKISRHLAVLKQAGLVSEWREGTWMHHGIAQNLSPAWRQALQGLRDVWDEAPAVRELLARISEQVARQPDASCGEVDCLPRKRRTRWSCCPPLSTNPQPLAEENREEMEPEV